MKQTEVYPCDRATLSEGTIHAWYTLLGYSSRAMIFHGLYKFHHDIGESSREDQWLTSLFSHWKTRELMRKKYCAVQSTQRRKDMSGVQNITLSEVVALDSWNDGLSVCSCEKWMLTEYYVEALNDINIYILDIREREMVDVMVVSWLSASEGGAWWPWKSREGPPWLVCLHCNDTGNMNAFLILTCWCPHFLTSNSSQIFFFPERREYILVILHPVDLKVRMRPGMK